MLKHLFKPAVTLEYPEKTSDVGEKFRGKPVVLPKCARCGTCMRVCPSGAIKLQDNEFRIDLKKCIFCGNCSFYCPSKSIIMSDCYELASSEKESLELIYEIGGENERNI